MDLVVGQRDFLARTTAVEAPTSTKHFAGISEAQFASSAMGGPLPLAWGQFKLPGHFMSPIFADRAEPITQKVPGLFGSSKITIGYNYYGSYALDFCHGPLTELTELRVGDTAIWTGPLARSGGNEDGVQLTTDIGDVMFYWGTETQLADPTLQLLDADQPGFRGTCYLVAMDVLMGQTPSPPTIVLVGKRQLALLTLSAHTIGGDAVLPECLYDILTNARYGVKRLTAGIDTTSFQTAGNTLVTEGTGVSPFITDKTSLRTLIGDMLTYMRGVLYYDAGKIKLKLIREDAEVATEITVDDLEDVPRIVPGEWESTWNRTNVKYTNMAGNWEDDVYTHPDLANAKIRNAVVSQDISRAWITRIAVAKAEGARLATLHGLPLASYSLRLKPSMRTIRPGQLLKLVYPKLNIAAAYMRPESVTVGGPDDPIVDIEAVQDPARQTLLSFVPSGSATGQSGHVTDPLVAPTVRVATLTTELKDGATDGMLVAMSRPTGATVRSETHFTWDPAQASYELLSSSTGFPIYGAILWWVRNGTGWIIRFQVDGAFDVGQMSTIAENFDDYYLVAGRREVVTSPASDTHKLLFVLAKRKTGGRFAAISADTFDIEVEGAQYGTTNLALETTLAAASVPTGAAFFGLLTDFTIIQSNSLAFDQNLANAPTDSAKRRYIKCLVGDSREILTLGDVTAVEFKRADTSMDANGSYSPTWGNRAKTAYEMFNVEAGAQFEGTPGADYANVSDIDAALGRVYEGTSTADDTALLASIDTVLGAYLENGNGIYNDTP